MSCLGGDHELRIRERVADEPPVLGWCSRVVSAGDHERGDADGSASTCSSHTFEVPNEFARTSTGASSGPLRRWCSSIVVSAVMPVPPYDRSLGLVAQMPPPTPNNLPGRARRPLLRERAPRADLARPKALLGKACRRRRFAEQPPERARGPPTGRASLRRRSSPSRRGA